MHSSRKLALVISLLLSMALLQSCFMFRKKNKCNTCPTFSSGLKKEARA